MALTGDYDAAKSAAQAGDAMTLTGDYDAAKSAAQAGDAMTLTGDYDAAKTAAQAGDEMDLVDAPNATAVTVIQSGLAVPGDEMDLVDAPNATAVTAIQSGLAVPGDEMDLVDAPNATALSALATAVWAAGTRTLTSFGSLVSSVASAILAVPANLLKTNASGQVETSNELETAAIATAVWAKLTSALTTAGSVGKWLLETLGAVKAKTDYIGAGMVTWSSPVDTDGTMELIQGDDYDTLTEIITDYTGPDLSGSTIVLRLLPVASWNAGTLVGELEINGTFTVNGTTVTCLFALTAAETAALESAPPKERYNYKWQVVATKSGKIWTVSPGIGSANIVHRA